MVSKTKHALIATYDGNKIISVYLHLDGDIEKAGFYLYRFYNAEEKVKNLIKNGNIIGLSTIADITYYYSSTIVESHEMAVYDNIDSLISKNIYDIDYIYLYENGNWKYSLKDESFANFYILSEYIIENIQQFYENTSTAITDNFKYATDVMMLIDVIDSNARILENSIDVLAMIENIKTDKLDERLSYIHKRSENISKRLNPIQAKFNAIVFELIEKIKNQ